MPCSDWFLLPTFQGLCTQAVPKAVPKAAAWGCRGLMGFFSCSTAGSISPSYHIGGGSPGDPCGQRGFAALAGPVEQNHGGIG